MLPFLKRNQEASVSMPPETITRKPDEGAEEYDSLHSAAEDLKAALASGSIPDIAEALRAAYEICASEPHIED